MSRTLKKKKHWSSKVQECAVSWGSLGEFGNVVEVLGGAEHGEFPYLGQMKLDVMLCHVGTMPYFGDVLLEINGTPVSGLTNRDTHAVIRHFREPIRLKTVKPADKLECCEPRDVRGREREGAKRQVPPHRISMIIMIVDLKLCDSSTVSMPGTPTLRRFINLQSACRQSKRDSSNLIRDEGGQPQVSDQRPPYSFY